jgi:hypothetical protein
MLVKSPATSSFDKTNFRRDRLCRATIFARRIRYPSAVTDRRYRRRVRFVAALYARRSRFPSAVTDRRYRRRVCFVAALYERRIRYPSAVADRRYSSRVGILRTGGAHPSVIFRRRDRLRRSVISDRSKIFRREAILVAGRTRAGPILRTGRAHPSVFWGPTEPVPPWSVRDFPTGS